MSDPARTIADDAADGLSCLTDLIAALDKVAPDNPAAIEMRNELASLHATCRTAFLEISDGLTRGAELLKQLSVSKNN